MVGCSLALADTPKGNVEGTIVKVDAAMKMFTVKTDSGMKRISVSQDTQFFGQSGGASADGIADKRLVPGASVQISMTSNNRWAKEVHIVSGPQDKSLPREDRARGVGAGAGAMGGAARTTTPAPSQEENQAVPHRERAFSRANRTLQPGDAGNPLTGTIVKVDQAHGTITIDIDGTKTEYTVDSATQFIGPRRGISSKGIEDDRVVQGAPVSIIVSGKVLREVRLPYRNQIGK
jgi:hypothetical protein